MEVVARKTEVQPLSGGVLVYARIRSVLLWLLSCLGALCIIVFLVGVIGGIRPSVVISGSMEPTIHTGDLTFARTIPSGEVKVGDILTVERPNNQGQVTHRVVAIQEVKGGHSFTLKGDANKINDFDNYLFADVGIVVGWIPYVGFLALTLKSQVGLAIAIAFIVGLLILTIMDPQRLRAEKPVDEDAVESPEPHPVHSA